QWPRREGPQLSFAGLGPPPNRVTNSNTWATKPRANFGDAPNRLRLIIIAGARHAPALPGTKVAALTSAAASWRSPAARRAQHPERWLQRSGSTTSAFRSTYGFAPDRP